jgi:hypothetical protein
LDETALFIHFGSREIYKRTSPLKRPVPLRPPVGLEGMSPFGQAMLLGHKAAYE